MGKLVVSLDGVVIKEVQITKDKTTLGRRPYNDIVIDNLAVSGEHAVLQMVGRGRLHRRPEQHQRHLHQRQGRQEAAAGPQRHGRDRQVQDQVPGRRRHRLREDDDHEAGAAVPAAPAAPTGAPRDLGGLAQLAASAACGNVGAGADQGAQRRRRRPRGGADQGRHHGRQARRAGGLDHQAARRLRARPRRGRARPSVNGTPLAGETVHLKQRRRDRARRHADAVRPGGLSPRALRREGHAPPLRVTDFTT